MEISPRLSRMTREAAAKAGGDGTAAAEFLRRQGVSTYLAISQVYCSGDSLEEAAGTDFPLRRTLQQLWSIAEDEWDSYLYACARVRAIGRKHLQEGATASGAEVRAGSGHVMVNRSWSSRRTKTCEPHGTMAQEVEASRLQAAIDRAVAAGDDVRHVSKRLAGFEESGIPEMDRRKLLASIATFRATVATTIEQHLRSVVRLRQWAEARRKDP